MASPLGLATLTAAIEGRAESRLARQRPPQGARAAAVLLLLSDGPLPDLTFVERAATLSHHPGQMAFPGGGLDPGENAVDAALREAYEEIGLPPEVVTVIGALPPAHLSASGNDVSAVVGTWDGTAAIGVADPLEVASVSRLSVADLANPEHRWSVELGTGYRGPAFDVGGVFIWGFTAHLTDELLRLGGWHERWDKTRTCAIPERYFWDRRKLPKG